MDRTKVVREEGQAHKSRPIRITRDFLTEILKASKSWMDVLQTLRNYRCQIRQLYPEKFSVTVGGETKIFHEKIKFK